MSSRKSLYVRTMNCIAIFSKYINIIIFVVVNDRSDACVLRLPLPSAVNASA